MKLFRNSLEISKAVSFMNKLKSLHEDFCARTKLFTESNK